MFLRQSTSQVIRFGPFLDSTDGVTPETGLTIAQADMQLSKDGAAFAQKNAAGNATHDTDGWYSTTLNTTDTGTTGELKIQVNVSGALPVWEKWFVLTQSAYDALQTGTFNNLAATAIVSAGAITTSSGAVSSVTTTTNLTTNNDKTGYSVSALSSNVITAASIAASALDGKGDWNIGKTGYSLTQSFPANFSSQSITAGGLVDITQTAADKVWATAARVLTSGTNIVLAKGVGVTGFNDLSSAQVNAEMLDVLVTDTFSEVSVPGSTASIKDMIHYTFSRTTNKTTQTATTLAVRNTGDSGNLATATVSDDGTTFTKGKET